MLVEGAWIYRLPARIGTQILARNESLPQPVKDIAWKAQVRLCARHRSIAWKAQVRLCAGIAGSSEPANPPTSSMSP